MINIRRICLGESDVYRQLRLASLKDAPYAFSSTYESALGRSPESWREQADGSAQGSDRATFLVLDDETPIGIAALYRDPDRAEVGEVIQVWIDPKFRRQYIGFLLMDLVFIWADENGIERVRAKIMPGNEGAMRFYEKYGFRRTEEAAEGGTQEVVLMREVPE